MFDDDEFKLASAKLRIRNTTFANLFDDDAQADMQRGRAAIRNEYDHVFRSTVWRRMSISQLRWQSVGDRTEGKGELMSRIAWADGREVEQRVAMEMELGVLMLTVKYLERAEAFQLVRLAKK